MRTRAKHPPSAKSLPTMKQIDAEDRQGALSVALATVKQYTDGWLNLITGMGTEGRDRGANTSFEAKPWLTATECANLYHHDDICGTIANIFPEEALRRGHEITGPKKAYLDACFRNLGAVGKIQKGASTSRALGGALGVMMIDDHQTADQPVDWSRPWPVLCLDVYDRREAMRFNYQSDPTHREYANPKVFQIQPAYGGQTIFVHTDRILWFRGEETLNREREQLAGWDASVYQKVWDVCQKFANGYLSLDNMMTDASQAVLKIHGLLGLLGSPGGKELAQTRATLFDLNRGTGRTMFIDADKNEAFDKIKTDFAGVADVADRLASRLSAATRIPVTVLMGVSPAGMNATGESDIRLWYDRVETYRRDQIAPHFEKLIKVLIGPEAGHGVTWPSLYQESPSQAATTRYVTLQGDQILFDAGAASSEEMRDARMKGKKDLMMRAGYEPPDPVTPPPAAPAAPTKPTPPGGAPDFRKP